MSGTWHLVHVYSALCARAPPFTRMADITQEEEEKWENEAGDTYLIPLVLLLPSLGHGAGESRHGRVGLVTRGEWGDCAVGEGNGGYSTGSACAAIVGGRVGWHWNA